jgi:hypothetical protein
MSSGRLASALRDVVVLGCAGYLLLFVFVAVSRCSYPFEIEWMEGGMLTHAVRLLHGLPIYAKPSADFVAFFYPPAYPALVAAVFKVAGVTFGAGRAVSIAATLATFGLLFHIGRREVGVGTGLVAAGLYAASFRICGAYFDIARPDALAMAVTLGAAYLTYRARTVPQVLLAALVFVAAYFAKQTGAIVAAVAFLPLLQRDRKLALAFALTGGVVAGVLALVMNRATGGWFWTYVVAGHQGHRFYWDNFGFYYWRDLLFLAAAFLVFPLLALSFRAWPWRIVAGVLFLFLVAAVIQRSTDMRGYHMFYAQLWYIVPRRRQLVPPIVVLVLVLAWRLLTRRARLAPGNEAPLLPAFWAWMFVAGAIASALNHSTQWAYANCFMPVAVFGSLATALVFGNSGTRTASSGIDIALADHPAIAALLPLALVVQLVALGYDPRKQIPDARDRSAVATFAQRMSDLPGKLLVPAHPLFTYLRDGAVHLHQMGVGDMEYSGGVGDLGGRLSRGEWGAVVLDDGSELPGVEQRYVLSDRLTYDGRALWTRTGEPKRPLEIWRKNDGKPRELAPGISGNFEGPAYVGWTPVGNGFTRRPIGTSLGGKEGMKVATSRGASEGPSRLVSAPFVLGKPRITFTLAGDEHCHVRAMLGDREIGRATADDDEHLQPQSIDLRGFVGQTITLELVDDNAAATRNSSSGITVDDVRIAY